MVKTSGFRLEDRTGAKLQSDHEARHFPSLAELRAIELLRNAHSGSTPAGDSFSDPRIFRFHRIDADGYAVFRP